MCVCAAGVRVQDIEQDRCTVEWEACRCQGSDPITYILQLQQLHGTDLEYKQVGKEQNNLPLVLQFYVLLYKVSVVLSVCNCLHFFLSIFQSLEFSWK